MRYKSRRSRVAFSGAILIAIALACSDSTAPLSNRLRGTYELSTVLDSLTYSYNCASPAPGMPPRCRDTTVVNSIGRMHGFVTIGDTVAGSRENMSFQVPAGTLDQVMCGSCGPSASDYFATTATVGRDSLTFNLRLGAGVLVILDGTVADDTIAGKVVWHTYLGCCRVSYYTGTFVMKRQR